jgi:hypothetical protein
MSTPPYLAALKGEYGVTKMGWFKSYQEAFINTSRFRPIMHVIGFVMCVGYLMEFPHLKHERHSAKKKAAMDPHH